MADTSHETAGPGAKPTPALKGLKAALMKNAAKQFAWGVAGLMLLAVVLGIAAKVAVHAFNLMP